MKWQTQDMLLTFTNFLAFKEMFQEYKALKEGKGLDLSNCLVVALCKSPSITVSQRPQYTMLVCQHLEEPSISNCQWPSRLCMPHLAFCALTAFSFSLAVSKGVFNYLGDLSRVLLKPAAPLDISEASSITASLGCRSQLRAVLYLKLCMKINS